MSKSNDQRNSKQSPTSSSLTIADLLISDVFKKNNINLNKVKNELSNEKKQMIRNVVSDLTKQVNDYVENKQKRDTE